MKKLLVLSYGLICYLIFFATFLYAIGFVGNLFVPHAIDSAAVVTLNAPAWLVNLLLLSIFAIQHSVMARPAFKRLWTSIIPPVVERSTYVLLSSVALIIIFLFWQPMDGTIWRVEHGGLSTLLLAIFGIGWLFVLISTFLINHFDLFGLRQVWFYFRGQPYTSIKFVTPWIYRYVRHPIYVGFILAFWATPVMTTAHLFFAVVTTLYIFVGIQFEEHDLMSAHGDYYSAYRKQVSMIIPFLKGRYQDEG